MLQLILDTAPNQRATLGTPQLQALTCAPGNIVPGASVATPGFTRGEVWCMAD